MVRLVMLLIRRGSIFAPSCKSDSHVDTCPCCGIMYSSMPDLEYSTLLHFWNSACVPL